MMVLGLQFEIAGYSWNEPEHEGRKSDFQTTRGKKIILPPPAGSVLLKP